MLACRAPLCASLAALPALSAALYARRACTARAAFAALHTPQRAHALPTAAYALLPYFLFVILRLRVRFLCNVDFQNRSSPSTNVCVWHGARALREGKGLFLYALLPPPHTHCPLAFPHHLGTKHAPCPCLLSPLHAPGRTHGSVVRTGYGWTGGFRQNKQPA